MFPILTSSKPRFINEFTQGKQCQAREFTHEPVLNLKEVTTLTLGRPFDE